MDLGELGLGGNIAAFVAAAAIVWFAGRHVVRQADALEVRTGAGEALIGMLLLGFITALPELSVTVTASLAGNASLAVNNLLGGMSLNVALLAASDAAVRREALTSAVASPTPLLQGSLVVVLLALVGSATVVGDVALFGVGAWTIAIAAAYLACLWLIRRTRGRRTWVPEGVRPQPQEERHESRSVARILASAAAGAAFILAAGYVLARSGDTIAEQTGLGASFFAAAFLAAATSLPEISIVFSAVRMRRFEMAIGDIFGANLFCLALLLAVDAAYDGPPVLNEVGAFSTLAALLGILATGLFLAGLLERRHRMVLRMGLDSIAVLAAYAAGLLLLYRLR
jgi:cation:H+ antiporter